MNAEILLGASQIIKQSAMSHHQGSPGPISCKQRPFKVKRGMVSQEGWGGKEKNLLDSGRF